MCAETSAEPIMILERYPKPAHCFGASGLIVDQQEDKLALSAAIASVEDTVHIGAVHKGTQDIKLFLFAIGCPVLPDIRQDWQGVI